MGIRFTGIIPAVNRELSFSLPLCQEFSRPISSMGSSRHPSFPMYRARGRGITLSETICYS